MQLMRVSIAIAFSLATACTAFAAKPQPYTLTGKVVAIADGDTFAVLDESKTQHKIRLAGIDAPEKGQPFGTKAWGCRTVQPTKDAWTITQGLHAALRTVKAPEKHLARIDW
jgi:endonuclease YncB( thermonuclease family)